MALDRHRRALLSPSRAFLLPPHTFPHLPTPSHAFSRLPAPFLAGAFFLSSDAKLVGVRALANAATSSGGAFEASNAELELYDSYLGANAVPSGLGGGLTLRSQSSAFVRGVEFESNRAANGAAIALQDANLDAENAHVHDNTAAESGGGVYARSSLALLLRNLTVANNSAPRGGGLMLQESAPVLEGLLVTDNRAAMGGGLMLTSCVAADVADSTFERNNASDEQLLPTATATALVEGGACFCQDTPSLSLRNLTLSANEASSLTPTRASGGGLAARDCTGALSSVRFDGNAANEAGGVIWRGDSPLNIIDGRFIANRGKVNVYSGALMHGSAGPGGMTGGGMTLPGCTTFGDSEGNSLQAGDACDEGVARRRLTSGLSLSMLGVSTPVDRLAWTVAWGAEGANAISGAIFTREPNCTVVAALDAYNNTAPTAEGLVTANPDFPAGICEACGDTAPLVEGVARFCQLGLTHMPGTAATIVFSSSVGAPSMPMPVEMALCAPGQYLNEQGKVCAACQAGKYTSSMGNATSCTDCEIGKATSLLGATSCLTCSPGTAAGSAGLTECAACGPGTASVDPTSCEICPRGTSPDNDNARCTSCPAGEYSAQPGAERCARCPDLPSSYSQSGAESCEECHEGARRPPQVFRKPSTSSTRLPPPLHRSPPPSTALTALHRPSHRLPPPSAL